MLTRLTIREKIIGLLVFYFLVALIAIGSTLFVSWRLEGGAAAINDAGRERMRSYRIAFLLARYVQHPTFEKRKDIDQEIVLFEKTLEELEAGNPDRPLFLPKDTEIRDQIEQLRIEWEQLIKPHVLRIIETATVPSDP